MLENRQGQRVPEVTFTSILLPACEMVNPALTPMAPVNESSVPGPVISMTKLAKQVSPVFVDGPKGQLWSVGLGSKLDPPVTQMPTVCEPPGSVRGKS